MSDTPRKRRLFIVGGKGKNVPRWLSTAFDYEQFDQENSKTRTLEPTKTPDAVIVLKSWIGHEHFYGARDLAERLGVPMIPAAGGWSSALKAASDLGVEWFIQDIERVKSSSELTESQVDEVTDFIDNAWREAYEREYRARQALEKRYGQDRRKLDSARHRLETMQRKDEAAQRVILEIRAAAARQRKASDEVQARSERVAEALVDHITTLKELFDAADAGHSSVLQAASRLSEAKRRAQSRLDALKAAMTIAEDGLAMVRQVHREDPSPNPVSASNAESDS